MVVPTFASAAMTATPPSPSDAEINGVFTLALLAALADGNADDRERAYLREVATRVGGDRIDLAVLDRTPGARPSIADAVRPLSTPEMRRYAYEVAVAVVAADGTHTPAEGAFLRDLASALGLPAQGAQAFVAQADAIAAAPAAAIAGTVMPDAAALDKQVLDASITNAALELLPETLASMAILPLQVRLVYRIGKAYGYELDQGHIKEFIAAAGVGLAGQYLEQFGRKLLGGLLGTVLGGMGRAAGHQAASSGMAFATTWALGQVAKQYYGGGRTLDMDKLKAAFAPLLAQGQALVDRYGGDIAQRARTIDVRNLPALIKGL